MGLGYNMLDVTGGNVNISFFSLKDRWLEYYKLMNGMFQKGYFNRETWALPYAQTKQIAQSGKMFSLTANCPASDEMNTVSAQNKDAQRFTPIYPPPTYKGKVLYSPLDMSIGWACLFITKNCSKPDRAIRFAEYLKSPEGQRLSQWGVEGVHYQTAGGGLLRLLDRALKPTQAENGLGLWYFEASSMNESVKQVSLKISAPDFSTQVDLMQAMKPYFMRNPALYRAVNPEGNSDAAKIKAKVNDIFRKADIEMMCATSADQIDQLYNKMLDDMKASNYGVFEKYLKDMYAKDKKKYDDYAASLKK
jgi:putative aldouronate transport system substrate-binding protein